MICSDKGSSSHEREWVGVVHSSTGSNSNFLQEVDKLVKQKNEAKDDDKRRDLTQKLELKTLESDLAYKKQVR